MVTSSGQSRVLDGIAMSKAPSGLKKALSFRVVDLALRDAPALQIQHGSVQVTSQKDRSWTCSSRRAWASLFSPSG